MKIHLTLTGSSAGQRLCGRMRLVGEINRHYMYSPIEDVNFRSQVCEDCLKEIVNSYDIDEDKPDWVREFFEDKKQLKLL